MQLGCCQWPKPLQPGDSVRVISPSGALREVGAFYRGIKIWQDQGYRVELSPDFDQKWGYLAGTDDQRRSQFRAALNDPDCRAIVCARGGYGGTRLLEDWAWGSPDPKWLIGFSDITSLLWSLCQTGTLGVHGPLLTTLAQEPPWSIQRLFQAVTGRSLGVLEGNGWGGGHASGLLLPGNLTVATHLLNTVHQPACEGVILALEDVSEAPYRIDRMLTYWRMCGALSAIAGLALGRFSQCQPPSHLPSFTVDEVLRDRLGDLGIPVVSDLPFGHDGVNAALPMGIPVRLDGDRGRLEFEL